MIYGEEVKVLSGIKNQPFAKIYQLKYLFMFVLMTLISYFLFDKPIAMFFYRLCEQDNFLSKFLIVCSKMIQFLGNGVFLFPVIFLSLVVLKRYLYHPKIFHGLMNLAWCLALMNFIIICLKSPIGRARPILYVTKHIDGFDFFNFGYNYLSFPSGHTVNVTVMVALMSYYFPKRIGFWIVLGVFMVSFRIVYLKHYLSDVILSIYLTLLLMPIAMMLFEKLTLKFPLLMNLEKRT